MAEWVKMIPKSAYTTWGVMAVLVLLSVFVVRDLKKKGIGGLQSIFELFMEQLCSLIKDIIGQDPAPFVPLVGTMLVFVFFANFVGMIPGLSSPTADLGVTSALAAIVFFAVPIYGVGARGVKRHLKAYLEPNPFMLPFNILGEFTRTLSLAVRLFGNIMSGEFLLIVVFGVVTTILHGYVKEQGVAVAGVPAAVVMVGTLALTLFLSILSLITAAIQAYIFTVLTLVYIGGAVQRDKSKKPESKGDVESAEADEIEQPA